MLALYLSFLDDDSEKRLLEKIYNSYRKQMFLVAKEVVERDEDAEDVVHEVFYEVALKHMKMVSRLAETDLRNYMLKAAKNRAINAVKKKTKESVYLDTVIEHDVEHIRELSDESFLDVLCEKMEYEQILVAMKSMDKRYQDVLYYHFVLEFTVPETAKALGRKQETIKKQLARGKKMLLRLLEEKGVGRDGD